ncbi:hypothetical protein E3V39_05940 [Gammaproteobacteria bacterium LSUCC0112]|nr:hypothetical protein E3V39_05940 [Gammaproteobacteria bacterium LSUCC0112]
MADIKTIETNHSVDMFIDTIKDESRRQDCRALTKLMAAATGMEPRMWGATLWDSESATMTMRTGSPARFAKLDSLFVQSHSRSTCLITQNMIS